MADIASAALRHVGIDPADATAAVQGFGKVGRAAVEYLATAGIRVVAVSDIDGAVHDPQGLDVAALEGYVDRVGTVAGFAPAIDPESLSTLDVDLLVQADRILSERHTLVVPDILANAGGVVVSYFECVQANQAFWWSEAAVNARLSERMERAWREVLDHAIEHAQSLRLAETCLAVERVHRAHELRGLYP